MHAQHLPWFSHQVFGQEQACVLLQALSAMRSLLSIIKSDMYVNHFIIKKDDMSIRCFRRNISRLYIALFVFVKRGFCFEIDIEQYMR